MNANDTVGALAIGTAANSLVAAGDYTTSSGLVDNTEGINLITGSGTLTVAGAPLYWDTNGADPGTDASSTGSWGDSTWSLDPNGESATTYTRVDGYDAVFSTGTDATGTHTITVDGTHQAKSLAIEEGTVIFSQVNNGTIDLVSGNGTRVANISNGATLGGNVTIVGDVTGPGNIAPGLSPGVITIEGAFDISGTYLWELGALVDDSTGTAGGDWDLVSTTSADLSAVTLDIDFILAAAGLDPDSGDSFWNEDHSWLVVDSTDPITTGFLGLTYQGGAINFDAGSFDTAIVGNQAFLQFTSTSAVPEPTTLLLATFGLFSLGFIGWRRRRR
jgi:hypothetical protein